MWCSDGQYRGATPLHLSVQNTSGLRESGTDPWAVLDYYFQNVVLSYGSMR